MPATASPAGLLCCRLSCPATTHPPVLAGAPAPLPEFLQPSIPTKSNAAWRNAEQRAADRAAKLTAAGLAPPPLPVRWVRVPDGGTGGGEEDAAPAALPITLPAVLPAGVTERQLSGLEVYFPDPDPGATALGGLASPPKRGGWGKKRLLGEDGAPLAPGGSGPKRAYAPHSQEARDAKSGRGRKRLFLHPVIRQRDRCGKCPVRTAQRCAELLNAER